MLFQFMFLNLRIVGEDFPTTLKSNQFATVSFDSRESCESNDFSCISQVIYSNEDATLMNGECLDLGGLWLDDGPFTQSLKCDCDRNTHFFSCTLYNSSSDCTGISTPYVPCSADTLQNQFCGSMDFVNSINGVLVDLSDDIYVQAGRYYSTISTDVDEVAMIYEIYNNKLTIKQCNDEEYCIIDASQEYEMNKNKRVQSLMVGMDIYGGFGGTFYAYDTKPLEIQKGGSGRDEVYILDSLRYYEYKAPGYEGCYQGTTRECLSNGSVLVTHFKDDSCTDFDEQDILEYSICGTLPTNNDDIKKKLSPDDDGVNVLILLFVASGSVALVVIFLIVVCVILISAVLIVVGIILVPRMVLSKKGEEYQKV